MTESPKKTKVPAKGKKVEAVAAPEVKVAAEAKSAVKKIVPKAAKTGIAIVKPVSHDDVAALAHRYWAERGHQHGQHVDDWFRAEQELRGKAS